MQDIKLKIPEKIRDNYKIEGNLSNINNWKARIYENNSASKESKKGDFDSVGYVMIGLNPLTIIPIARADEHHTGYDLIYKLKGKGLIPSQPYYSIYNGNNYVNESDLNKYIEAFKSAVELGFNSNLPVKTINSNKMSTVKELIENSGWKEYQKGELTYPARKVIDLLEESLNLYEKYLDKPNILMEEKFIEKAKELIKFVSNYIFDLFILDIPNYTEKKEKILNSDSVQEIAEFLFGHTGIKNVIHNGTKKFLSDKNSIFTNRYFNSFVGDSEEFLSELNRLSSIKLYESLKEDYQHKDLSYETKIIENDCTKLSFEVLSKHSLTFEYNFQNQLNSIPKDLEKKVREYFDESIQEFIGDLVESYGQLEKSALGYIPFFSLSHHKEAKIHYYWKLEDLEFGMKVDDYTPKFFTFRFYCNVTLKKPKEECDIKDYSEEKLKEILDKNNVTDEIHHHFSAYMNYFTKKHFQMYGKINELLKNAGVDLKQVRRPIAMKMG